MQRDGVWAASGAKGWRKPCERGKSAINSTATGQRHTFCNGIEAPNAGKRFNSNIRYYRAPPVKVLWCLRVVESDVKPLSAFAKSFQRFDRVLQDSRGSNTLDGQRVRSFDTQMRLFPGCGRGL
jgi:hypothetical protein